MSYCDWVTVPRDPGADSGAAERRVGRYVLEDLVAEHAGTSLWRASDPALKRPVGARLIALDDPRADTLRAAAQAAAGVDDRRLVRVLDVVETGDQLAIVTEWVTGQSWSELLNRGGSVQEALVVGLEVARALETAHEAGVTHGRIRPDSVMITDTKEVRLRGLGVEAAIWGVDPEVESREADIHGVGALVYAGSTLYWPTKTRSGSVDGLHLQRPVDGRLPRPSDLVADIPAPVDEICARSLVLPIAGPRASSYTDISEVLRALEGAVSSVQSPADAEDYAEQTSVRTDRLMGRFTTAAIFVFALAGVGLLVWQLMANVLGGPAEQASASDSASAVEPIPDFQTPLPESALTIASARDFDPEGDDSENPNLANKSIDGSKKTAWVTADYPNANMNPKGGVGLILDMGTVRPFRALNLQLYGSGSDFQILTSKKKAKKMSDFKKVVEISAAGGSIKVRTPKPVKARHVMIWFTGLPYDGANYVGGVRDVKIVG